MGAHMGHRRLEAPLWWGAALTPGGTSGPAGGRGPGLCGRPIPRSRSPCHPRARGRWPHPLPSVTAGPSPGPLPASPPGHSPELPSWSLESRVRRGAFRGSPGAGERGPEGRRAPRSHPGAPANATCHGHQSTPCLPPPRPPGDRQCCAPAHCIGRDRSCGGPESPPLSAATLSGGPARPLQPRGWWTRPGARNQGGSQRSRLEDPRLSPAAGWYPWVSRGPCWTGQDRAPSQAPGAGPRPQPPEPDYVRSGPGVPVFALAPLHPAHPPAERRRSQMWIAGYRLAWEGWT